MKNISFLLFLCFSTVAFSQLITEVELKDMVESAQEKCVGAHESIVRQANEDIAKSIWGKKVRFNDANVTKFFVHSSGEKVSAGFNISTSNKKSWVHTYNQQTAADLLVENGVRVTQSYNTLWIKANQNLLFAENIKEGRKTILELYCPHQRFLELLRTGQAQSIEFLITGYLGSVSSNSKIYGVLTQVNAEKQSVKCSNGHEFDKAAGYKFCPTCGEPLE
jgi:hypothetical protein